MKRSSFCNICNLCICNITFKSRGAIFRSLDSSDVSAMHSANHLGGASLTSKEYHSFGGLTLKISLAILWRSTCLDEGPSSVGIGVSAPSRELGVHWIGCIRLPAANGFHGRFNHLDISHCLKLLSSTSDVKQ